jgi:hypothetical protein
MASVVTFLLLSREITRNTKKSREISSGPAMDLSLLHKSKAKQAEQKLEEPKIIKRNLGAFQRQKAR